MRVTKHRLYFIARNAVKRMLPARAPEKTLYDDSKSFPAVDPVFLTWPDGLRKPLVGLVPDAHPKYPYWTKYRRFLETNEIPFVLYDIHESGWAAAARELDIIIWRPFSGPPALEECRRKIYLLEKRMGKCCYPDFAMAMLYEDKILQFELLKLRGLPVVETFISHSYEETLRTIPHLHYPVVAKLVTGSGSAGIELIRNEKAARDIVRRAFSFAGRRTYWPYHKQKDYIYFQRFIPDAESDLRVIIVGDAACGYYRDVPKGEFRASGMQTQRNADLPKEALLVAREVAKKLGLFSVAVDMLYDRVKQAYLIIEISFFVVVESTIDAPVCINGVIGVYRFLDDSDNYSFEPAEFWLQEWVLREFFKKIWLTGTLGSNSDPALECT